MLAERTPAHEDTTLAETMVDQASQLLSSAIDGSPDPDAALERALENLGNHGHDIPKQLTAEQADRNWHVQEHTWALVANLVFEAKLLRPSIPPAVRYRMIDRMLSHDEHWSKINHDLREPDQKDTAYWRDRLRVIQRSRR